MQRTWTPPSDPSARAAVTVGWREWVAFPEWGVPAMKAKIDTGARTSALHAIDLQHFERDGAAWASFVIHPWQATDDDAMTVEAPVVDEREVTSSSGTTSLRTVVAATVQLDNVPRRIEVTLTRRDDMGFRMLIGREALRGHFVVDPERSYLTGRPSKELRRKNRNQ